MNTLVMKHSIHKYGFTVNDVWQLLYMPIDMELPVGLLELTNKPYLVDSEHLKMFFELARARPNVKYDDNQIRQKEINKLYDLKASFESAAVYDSPIKRIEIDFFKGEPVVLSNKLLLDNFYFQMHEQLNNFIATYIQENYKPPAANKRTGLSPANKQLALKMLCYFELKHSDLIDKEVGYIIRKIFSTANNELPYSDDKDCIQKLKKIRNTKSAEAVEK